MIDRKKEHAKELRETFESLHRLLHPGGAVNTEQGHKLSSRGRIPAVGIPAEGPLWDEPDGGAYPGYHSRTVAERPRATEPAMPAVMLPSDPGGNRRDLPAQLAEFLRRPDDPWLAAITVEGTDARALTARTRHDRHRRHHQRNALAVPADALPRRAIRTP
ncbi:hypothetical protein GFS60_06564 (plasmid) [Rhodococcus sp. WAY2]|nr:hypothetical protein GFS60_06564 [Rhodococcus sp. WAY2]